MLRMTAEQRGVVKDFAIERGYTEAEALRALINIGVLAWRTKKEGGWT